MALGMKNHISGIRLPASGISFLCPLIDARRMEVYSALYDTGLKNVTDISARIIDSNSFNDDLKTSGILFAGNGASKCKPLLEHQKNAFFLENFTASAKFMVPLADEKWSRKQFEDMAYFEPFYLKDFIAGKPSVKGLT